MIIRQGPQYSTKASHTLEGCSSSVWAYRWRFAWNYNWKCRLQLLDRWWAAINRWGLCNRVACIEEPHTMHGAYYTAGFRFIHEESQRRRLHQGLGSPWVRWAIWREWMQRRWDESKTLKRGQCSNRQGVCHETSFRKDNWESPNFKIFWKSWN